MSYVQSLRFKLMLLCIVPLLACAFLFIGHSVLIAFQLRDIAADTYLTAVQQAEAPESVLNTIQNVSVDMGWITKQWALVFGILFVCFYIPITINIAKFIKPIRQLAKESDSLAKGDISIQVTKNRTDEIGILQGSFQDLVSASRVQAALIKRIADSDISGEYIPRSDTDIVGHSIVKMLEGNNEMLSHLATATQQMSVVSRQIADGSHSLASGSSQQAAAIECLTKTIQEVAKIPQESLQLAKKAADLADTAKNNAENGNRQMSNMVLAVDEIRDSSLAIQKVIKVIDDIAFQTNILALNAAVEAARAGQYGKGFAVVAEEVRNLASKSAEAAKDTGSLIASSMEKASLGVRIVGEASASIEGIVMDITKSSEIIQEIAELSSSQDVSISGISENINQMANVVNSNSSMSEEYAASSEEMNGQVGAILDMVSQFKLRTQIHKLS